MPYLLLPPLRHLASGRPGGESAWARQACRTSLGSETPRASQKSASKKVQCRLVHKKPSARKPSLAAPS
eukprot:1140354-Pyramimonas_sp.AAC.1